MKYILVSRILRCFQNNCIVLSPMVFCCFCSLLKFILIVLVSYFGFHYLWFGYLCCTVVSFFPSATFGIIYYQNSFSFVFVIRLMIDFAIRISFLLLKKPITLKVFVIMVYSFIVYFNITYFLIADVTNTSMLDNNWRYKYWCNETCW